jgi:hypothetical protein
MNTTESPVPQPAIKKRNGWDGSVSDRALNKLPLNSLSDIKGISAISIP